MPVPSLSVAGLSHHTAPVSWRECFAFSADMVPQALARLRELGAEHAVLLSTCNRTEVYCWAERRFPIESFFTRHAAVPEQAVAPMVYVKHGADAVRHLFRVAAGLDSQAIGESEIVAQLKKAWSVARAEGATGPFLDAALQHAMIVAKRARAETDLGRQVVSIGSLAVRMALATKPDFENATVLVVGTGEMGARIVREIQERPHRRLLVVSHTMQYAEDLAALGNGVPMAICQMGDAIAEADIVFTVTDAPHPIIEYRALAHMTDRRAHRPLFIFDLAVPRNAEPAVRDLPFVVLHDIEDLRALSDAHRSARESAVPQAEQIVHDELIAFREWCARRGVAPLISSLRSRAEEIRVHQLEWAAPRLDGIPEPQRAVVYELTERLVKHLLHFPISELRSAAGEDAAVAVVARMLGLDQPLPAATPADGRGAA